MTSGGQCVMTSGILLMLMLYASSWDMLEVCTTQAPCAFVGVCS